MICKISVHLPRIPFMLLDDRECCALRNAFEKSCWKGSERILLLNYTPISHQAEFVTAPVLHTR